MGNGSKPLSRRSFLRAVGGTAVVTSVAGCSSGDGESADGETETTQDGGNTQSSGGPLTYARGSSTSTLDPQAITSLEDSKVSNQIYDTLVQLDPGTATLTQGLCTEWALSETGITFTLREGVKFHNGDELTAKDVVATYRRHLDPDYEHYAGEENLSSRGQQELGVVSDVTTNGDYEVTFELDEPYAPILSSFPSYSQSILPATVIEEGEQSLAEEPVGTGPFKLNQWDTSSQRIRLDANTDYWGHGPSVDEVLFRVIPQSTTRAQALDAGEVDVADGLGPQPLRLVENSGNASVQSTEGINVGFMAMNLARFEPFRDRRVRQAMNYAIDMGAILDTVFQGTSVASTQPIPPGIMGHNDGLEPYPHDPEQAQQLLSDAGYGDGFSFELSVMTNPRPYNPAPEQAAQTIQSNLSDVGVGISINRMPFGPYVEYVLQGRHDACFLGFSARPDPNFFAHKLLHPQVSEGQVPEGQDWVAYETEGYSAFGMTAWANREYMDLAGRAQTTLDRDQRDQLYQDAMALAYDEAPWVFMNHADIIRGVHNRVSGWVPDKQVLGPYLNLVEL